MNLQGEVRCTNIPLRFGTAVVVQCRLGRRRVGLVVVEIGSKRVVASVELCASSLMVAGQYHVRNLRSYV